MRGRRPLRCRHRAHNVESSTAFARETENQVALALECTSPAEVDEVYERVVAAGFRGEKEPWDAFWDQRYAQLRSPDGVPVDLYATL